jgi:hypothetical protein
MQNRLVGGPPLPELFHGIAEFHVHSEVKRNCQSHVQIMTSMLELPTGKLQESCLWMVDCRAAAMGGGSHRCSGYCKSIAAHSILDDRSDALECNDHAGTYQ